MRKICLLKPGFIQRDNHRRILDASSSVTLIMSEKKKIIVDTGKPGEENLLVKALSSFGLRPYDIDILINTHSHLDHCGNNELFSQAEIKTLKEFDMIIPGVLVLETPGHSQDSISILISDSVRIDKHLPNKYNPRIIISGDALPTLGNFLQNVPPALRTDPILAMNSMHRIITEADLIIPGHDRPFSIREKKYFSSSIICLKD